MMNATSAGAQGRVEQVHRASEPEGRLLAYYSATMAFSPLGTVAEGRRWSVGMEASWIPRLSEAQRRPGIDKPETTNLASVLPRPRIAVRTAVVTLEASWVPPLTVGDARANLWGFAASRTVVTWRGVRLAPRLSLVAGRVEGSITCNARTMANRGRDLAVYYARVCHGNDSNDWFVPRLMAGELMGTHTFRAGRGEAWLLAGGRVDRSRFDIGVRTAAGTRDTDHPILQLEDTRPHLGAGMRVAVTSRMSVASELFFAPGSVATVRALVAFTAKDAAHGATGAGR
ncbi:MAG: hypothetical protein IT359_08305 [Gemmatimonadaceae bacterium]|nr:hypothetical protein [Gemmatimonadaceae bacterium]